MSGNFDFPPASDRPGSPTDQPQWRLRVQHMRDLLDARVADNPETYDEPGLDNHPLLLFQRELLGLATDPTSASRSDRRPEDTANTRARLEQLSFERARRRGDPSSILGQSRTVQEHQTNDASGPTNRQRRPRPNFVDEAESRGNAYYGGLDNLRWAADRISGRLASTNDTPDERGSTFVPSSLTTQGSSNNTRGYRRRPKRRKLDTDDKREGPRGFSYGHYGQVVPGALDMEIVSCDGGTYESQGANSFPENVLINDSSVYCTKSDRCNLILRHQGETPFCLKKIVIKAPKSGFDAPIQEGMVFVSMTSDELLARTAQYQIVYSPTGRRPSRRRHPRSRISQQYLSSTRSPLQSLERTVLAGPGTWSDSDNEPITVPSNTRPSAPNRPSSDFRITTNFDDRTDDEQADEDDSEHATSLNDASRLGFGGAETELFCPDPDSGSESESDDDTPDSIEDALAALTRRNRRRLLQARGEVDYFIGRGRRRIVPSLIEPSSLLGGGNAMNERTAPSGSDEEVMKPHARFFIQNEKSMVSIKFDPPVSGRFILIKLWSPFSGGNIDIQSVAVHGFAGSRFFPAVQMR
ncbi:hypothetical protein FQN55_000300 [Onygenales sp. PD_40]|nr:hypothetical protein FQN55_000300 [Onygenales sp. PD_40]